MVKEVRIDVAPGGVRIEWSGRCLLVRCLQKVCNLLKLIELYI